MDLRQQVPKKGKAEYISKRSSGNKLIARESMGYKASSMLTRPFAREAKNLTTSYFDEAAAWCSGVQPSESRARTSSGRGSSSDTRDVLPLDAARWRSVLKRSFLKKQKQYQGKLAMRQQRLCVEKQHSE